MAWTVTTMQAPNTTTSRKEPWTVSFAGDDVTACEEIVAAIAGKCHYVQRIALQYDGTGQTTLGAGDNGAGAVAAPLLGPIPSTRQITAVGMSNAIPFVYEFLNPPKVPVNTSITVDATAVGNIWGVIDGYTI